jgi:hypothetical protein
MTKHAATALANVLRFELKQWGLLYMISNQVSSGKLFVYYFLCTVILMALGSSTNDRSHRSLTRSFPEIGNIHISYINIFTGKFNSNTQKEAVVSFV